MFIKPDYLTLSVPAILYKCCNKSFVDIHKAMRLINAIRDWPFRSRSRMGSGSKKTSPPERSHISYNDETWHSCTLPKEDQKNIKIMLHTSLVLLPSAFLTRNKHHCYIKKYKHRLHFNT